MTKHELSTYSHAELLEELRARNLLAERDTYYEILKPLPLWPEKTVTAKDLRDWGKRP